MPLKFEDVEKVVAGVSSLIPVVGGLVSTAIGLVSAIGNATEEDKEALIKRIRDAQAAIPEWK